MKPWKVVVLGMVGAFFGVMLLAGMAFWADIFKVDQNGVVYLRVTDSGQVGIGNPAPTPTAQLHVAGTGTTSSTRGLYVTNASGTTTFVVRDDGRIGIGSTGPLAPVHVVNSGDRVARFDSIAPFMEFTETDQSNKKWYLVFDGTNFEIRENDLLTGRLIMLPGGNLGIGTLAPTSKLHVVGLPVYANNAAAVAGGLTPGAFYRTGGDPDLICVVH